MNADRAELIRLVEAIPEDQVSQVLADMRRQLQPLGRSCSQTWSAYRAMLEEPSYWT
jgi:hypothetical protein